MSSADGSALLLAAPAPEDVEEGGPICWRSPLSRDLRPSSSRVPLSWFKENKFENRPKGSSDYKPTFELEDLSLECESLSPLRPAETPVDLLTDFSLDWLREEESRSLDL